MAAVWVSFRIANRTVADQSYDDRLKALTKIFYNAGRMWWDKTTSFIIVETERTPLQLATEARSAIALTADVVLVRSMDKQAAYIVGNNDDDDIFKMVPYLKKL